MSSNLKRMVKSKRNTDSPEVQAIDLRLSEARAKWLAADTEVLKYRAMRELNTILDERLIAKPVK